MYLNGKEYNKSFITYDDIKNGADIHFVMNKTPNYKRAVAEESVPPSLSNITKTMSYQKTLQNSDSIVVNK